jgi:hypothetical protein
MRNFEAHSSSSIRQQNYLLKTSTADDDDHDDIDSYDHKSHREHYVERLKRQNLDKLLEDKEKKRLLDLKREIKRAPKKPKLLSLEVLT